MVKARRRLLAFVIGLSIGVVFPLMFVRPANAALHSRYFKMPSKNIGCAIFSGNLRCDILSGMKPEPTMQCDFDWTGLILSASGKASPVCASDTVYKKKAKTLQYGSKWKRHGIVCRSRTTGLRCRNKKDNGFFLSREKWNTY